jgi:hypothetical protein
MKNGTEVKKKKIGNWKVNCRKGHMGIFQKPNSADEI